MPRLLSRLLAAGTGIATGAALGPLIADGRAVEAASGLVFGAVLAAVLLRILPREDRLGIGAVVVLAYALRGAFAVALHLGSEAIGMDGFITGDDREYYQLARAFVLFMSGRPEEPFVPPYWGGQSYLFGTWVYTESLLFFIVGARPLVPIFLNCLLGALTALVVSDVASRIFGVRAARVTLLLVAFYPSLVLWSALNLKDPLALFLISATLWSLLQLQVRDAVRPLVSVGVALVLMQSLRGYIFTGLALLAPVAPLAAVHLQPARRTGLTVITLAVSAVLLVANQVGLGLGASLLANSEIYRIGMSQGARTAFIDAAAVPVEVGMTFVVPTQSQAPTDRLVRVDPKSRIVVVTSAPEVPTPAPSAGTVYVRPGDVIVVGADATPAPTEARIPLVIRRDDASVDIAPAQPSTAELTIRNLAYVPRGLVYSLFAPWPWLGQRTLDLLTIPEMLVWYVLLALAMLTVATHRAKWPLIAVPALFAAGTLLIFALVEGNWGTLFRHRSMVVPTVAMLASPLLARWLTARGGR